MNQEKWDHETAERADDRCRAAHRDVYDSDTNTNNLGKPVGSACYECLTAEKDRTAKLQKAHGVELGPTETDELYRRLGLTPSNPDLGFADTIPDSDSGTRKPT